MSPEEAVSHAAELFTQHLSLFTRFRDSIEKHEAELRGEKGSQNRLMDTPIEELDLSVRAFNCLKANEIQTVGQLLQKREEELLALRNFGRKSLDEIKQKLVEKCFIKPEEMRTVLPGSALDAPPAARPPRTRTSARAAASPRRSPSPRWSSGCSRTCCPGWRSARAATRASSTRARASVTRRRW